MIESFYIEEEIFRHPLTENILKRIPHKNIELIQNYADFFGRVKKPYLQKRNNLNAFIAQKKGQLVKSAPDAYGLSGEPHFYYIHAYNCIYECEYCYLQGHFNSPDLVFFVNHDEIIAEMQKVYDREIIKQEADKKIWFHAGEFSDSLALSHATNEIFLYHNFFEINKRSMLELRTKSANINEVLKLKPLPNIVTSFSLSPSQRAKKTDLKTPSTKHRILAMSKLQNSGHKVAIHLDPIVYEDNFQVAYQELFHELDQNLDLKKVEYISAGVVRFTKDVYAQVEKNYPQSDIHAAEMIKSFDGKVRYPRPMRRWMLSSIEDQLLKLKINKEKIYLCMED